MYIIICFYARMHLFWWCMSYNCHCVSYKRWLTFWTLIHRLAQAGTVQENVYRAEMVTLHIEKLRRWLSTQCTGLRTRCLWCEAQFGYHFVFYPRWIQIKSLNKNGPPREYPFLWSTRWKSPNDATAHEMLSQRSYRPSKLFVIHV